MLESRELPVGARQSYADGELALEQLAEGLPDIKRLICEQIWWQLGRHRRSIPP